MDFALSKEQIDIKNAAREFALGEFPDKAQEFDRTESFDQNISKKACGLGFLGIHMPEEYGGGGFGMLDRTLVTEEFYAVDAGMAVATLSPSFGLDYILMFGSEKQKQKYITEVVSGKAIMGTAVTEPDAGSDVSSASTHAVHEGDEYVINGSKMFITNGDIANYLLVFCVTDPDNEDRHRRHSFFLVETDRPGFEAKKITGKLGIRASHTAEIFLSDVKVPESNLLGEEGSGFKQLMEFFNITRVLVCAQGVGIARAAMEEAINYTKKRRQFGVTLSSFQVTQFKIAEMATYIQAARNLYYEAAWKIDNGNIDHSLVAMAKWFSGQIAVKCADEALQMHGGYGFIDEYKVQRLYRDAKIVELYEGTKEIEKIIVARHFLK